MAEHTVKMTTAEVVSVHALLSGSGQHPELVERMWSMLQESKKRKAWRDAPYCTGDTPVQHDRKYKADSGVCDVCGWRGRVWQGKLGKHKAPGMLSASSRT